MRTSEDGLGFLVREEGSIPYAYNDPVGHATFGIGHLIHHGGVTDADRARWGTRSNPRPELVMPTLRKDMPKYEAPVNALNVDLTQNEFDACVSLCVNIGAGGFASSTVARRLRAGNHPGAADAFLLWGMSEGKPILLPRRRRERKLFLDRDTPADWLNEDELRWVREFDGIERGEKPSHNGRRDVLIRVMTERRQSIWRAAQDTGWAVNDRRRRYASLLARTPKD